MLEEWAKAREIEKKEAFEQGAEAMRRACIAEFMGRVSTLRVQQRTAPDAHPIVVSRAARDLRLSADVSEMEHAAHVIARLPAPEYGRAEGGPA